MPGAVFVPARAEDLNLSFAAGVDSAAQGSVLYRSGASRYTVLAPGTSGQVLTSGGAAANPAWATPAATLDSLTDVNLPTASQGDLLYRNATEWVRLTAGTSGQALLTQGAAANPIWGAPAADLSPTVILAPATGTRNDIQPTADVTPLRLLARVAGQTNALLQAVDASSVLQARILATGLFSSPHTGTSSERFGAGSAAAGNNSTAIGQGASAAGGDSTAIGQGSSSAGVEATAIGRLANASNTDTVAIGRNTTASASGALAIGANVSASQNLSICIGANASATASGAIVLGAGNLASASGAAALGQGASATAANTTALGSGATASGSTSTTLGMGSTAAGSGSIVLGTNSTTGVSDQASVVIGRQAASTAAAQLVIGDNSNGWYIKDVYLCGVVGTTPQATSINANGGSGTNIAGGNLTLAGGKGTGSGLGGSLILSTAPAGSSGTTLGTLAARWTLDSTGLMTIADALNIAVGTTTGTKFGTTTSQKMGWWNVAPVVQQILATGTGATVDNVISLLQTLGLCRQS